jgi:sugar phosphate permease
MGLAVSVIFILRVREPKGVCGGAARAADAGLVATARFLLGSRAYVYTLAGGALVGVSLYASQVWHPSFLARVHHLGMAQIGASIGIPRGVAGLAGTLLGGLLAERLGHRDRRWALAAPGVACILALPAELVFLLSPHLPIALGGMMAYQLFIGMQFGPVYAACHTVAPSHMRCTATAIFLLVANLTGQVIGPLAVGYLNDRWAASLGPDAIRYSLLVGSACVAAGGCLMLLGARSLVEDTRRAEQSAPRAQA